MGPVSETLHMTGHLPSKAEWPLRVVNKAAAIFQFTS